MFYKLVIGKIAPRVNQTLKTKAQTSHKLVFTTSFLENTLCPDL